MQTDVKAAAESIARLNTALTSGEKPARAYLKSLDRDTAESLVNTLTRLGWYLPSTRRTAQQQLAWWLFRKDVERLQADGGQWVSVTELPRERLNEAQSSIESLSSLLNIRAKSCLSVLSYVLLFLQTMEESRQLPLHPRYRRHGVPEGHDFDDMFLIRFDGKCLNESMNRIAAPLELAPGKLIWSPPTGHPITTYQRYWGDVSSLLSYWRGLLEREVRRRGELPPGWEAGSSGWPDRPIRTPDDLSRWLHIWLDRLHESRVTTGLQLYSPEGYLDSIQRELRNTWRAAQARIVTLPSTFDDAPANIDAAEKQLVWVIQWLGKPGDNRPADAGDDPAFAHIADGQVRKKVKEILVQLESAKVRSILVAMFDLGATQFGPMVPANEIASLAIDPAAGANDIKGEMVLVKGLGLVDSKEGRSGGSRLTELGGYVAIAIQQQKNSSETRRKQ
jgi:hypothetical protein